MIFAALKDAARYHNLSPNFAAAFAFLRDNDLATLSPGRVNVLGTDGELVHALPQDNALKRADQCRWEGHRKYADIQLVISGVENMGVVPIGYCKESFPFDAAKDVAFFDAQIGTGSLLTVHADEFAIFFPEDIHMPLIARGGSATIPGGVGSITRKVVMKVAI